jgi:ParB family chromosome partitioning protein
MSDVNLRPESEGPRRADTRLPVEKLRPNPNQPRKDFEPAALEALADSLRQKGVIQPLVVRPSGDIYEIVAGERRWRAAQMAQLHEVPVSFASWMTPKFLKLRSSRTFSARI